MAALFLEKGNTFNKGLWGTSVGGKRNFDFKPSIT
jgi:hypothetical protein